MDLGLIFKLLETYGLGFVEFCIIIYLLWKIANNHLAHIAADVKTVMIDMKVINNSVTEIKQQIADDRERIATLEGRLM